MENWGLVALELKQIGLIHDETHQKNRVTALIAQYSELDRLLSLSPIFEVAVQFAG